MNLNPFKSKSDVVEDPAKFNIKNLSFGEALAISTEKRLNGTEVWIRPESWEDKRMCLIPDGIGPYGKWRVGPFGTFPIAFIPRPTELNEKWEVLTKEIFFIEQEDYNHASRANQYD